MGIRSSIKKRLPIFGSAAGQPVSPGGSAAASAGSQAAAQPTWDEDEVADTPRADVPVEQFIDELVKGNKIVIFMKGNPAQPMCGFSANAIGILTSYGRPLTHFDILSDPEVRQAVKEYSQWPTLPQIYVGGEFLGGSDILIQMHQSGELKQAIDEAFAEA